MDIEFVVLDLEQNVVLPYGLKGYSFTKMVADLILHINWIFATPKVKGISLPLL